MSSVSINSLKLKGIAVKRILEDYRGARDNIIEAQRIFPDLENVAQMFLVCDKLCAADVQFPGCGIDWYWVLQLHPSADDFDIVSQYKKLAALLEPIKNKFPGTVTAIKFY
ncbi:DnaJ domain-containing protein [Cinnamomum micranthum f. kanehirae]|uniref:DnaJ domain-containing protein n=1 Tax=Cinnamomum micranthum f. kanehirae TaxID=337451 RepID=A0A3S3QDE2_9MAGN|nr:DnaJ domain-containing protein [Cinnamomum micranthum f. kanehirae]